MYRILNVNSLLFFVIPELLSKRQRRRDVCEGGAEAVPRGAAEGGRGDGQEQVRCRRAQGDAGRVRRQVDALFRGDLSSQYAW